MEGDRALNWRKSSYSGNNGGQCVEVAVHGAVLVRDSKNPHGPVLEITTEMWRMFVRYLKDNAL
jgi:hypothetical protein